MGAVSGMLDTYDGLNYVGQLFRISPKETPFLAMIGGVHGGVPTLSKQFTWQTVDNATAGQPSISETSAAAGQTAAERSRTEVINVCQIAQYDLDISYRKQAAVGNIGGEKILGVQPVQDESSLQMDLVMERFARDAEYSFLQGAYVADTNVSTATTTRGLKNAITTNTSAAGGSTTRRPRVRGRRRDRSN